MTTLGIGRRTLEVEREEKILFPDAGITKGEVIAFYRKIAPLLLPHLRDRPLTLHRFPDGIDAGGFYQKEVPDYFPDWIRRATVPLEKGGSQEQVVADGEASLAYLANQACITLHMWLSRADDLGSPDRMIFDLDPGEAGFDAVLKGARALKDRLEALGLRAFCMVTGSSGAHVRVPLRRGPDFNEVRDFAGTVARVLADDHPDEFTTEVRKDARKGRLYLDVSRNAYGQTVVAPYTLRAKKGAPASVPLDWDELSRPNLAPDAYTLKNLQRRTARKEDPWKGMGRYAASLEGAREEWTRKSGGDEG